MERRSKLQIYLEILKFLNAGITKPTKLMYNLNISWKPMIRFLSVLQNLNLVEEKRGDVNVIKDKRTWRTFHITDKGRGVLQHFITFRREDPTFKKLSGFEI